jgi:predicted nuclease of predicted toxin-antitoxin system
VRFLANENIPLAAVRLLRERGDDVAAIAEEAAGVDDRTVLEWAARDQRIILTFDRDYGELLFRRRLPPPIGLIYFRFDPSTPLEPAEHVLLLLAVADLSLEEKFTVVERGRIRQRPMV